jgi:hypothetical protein
VIIWVNGSFGAGKTTTATKLVELSPEFRLFDPEWVGYLLSNNLSDHEFTDFQQLPPWRALVPPVADEIARFTGQHLVAVQTVLVEEYWQEIEAGLIGLGHTILQVLLDVEEGALHARIDADEDGHDIRKWRHKHVEPYLAARPWLLAAADLVIDTTEIDAETAAAQILRRATETTHPLQAELISEVG